MKELQPHQQRVLDEKDELEDRVSKLHAFIEGNPIFQTLPSAEQDRLTRQLSCMQEYSAILSERIDAFAA